MNEKIKELAEQAWVYQIAVYEDNGVRTLGEREQVFSKEKFAELIIEECIRAVKDADLRNVTYTTHDKDRVDYCRSQIEKNIKKVMNYGNSR